MRDPMLFCNVDTMFNEHFNEQSLILSIKIRFITINFHIELDIPKLYSR